MWVITIRSPDGEPREYVLKPGVNTVGRKLANDIVVSDPSASRNHAEVNLDHENNQATITDLDSTNGTFLNRRKLEGVKPLKDRDVIRIGTCLISVRSEDADQRADDRIASGTRPLTRELVLESFDSNAVLLFDIARQLNSLMEMDVALEKVTELIRASMGADACRIALPAELKEPELLDFPASIIELAVDKRSAVVVPDVMSENDRKVRESAALHRIRSAICAPIQASDETLLGVIYLYKSDPESRPFNEQDLQQVVAIGHIAALTLERVKLMERIRREQSIREMLQRFVAPSQFDELWETYLADGALPGLTRRDATILFSDIGDSTGLAERIGTQRFGELLSSYYAQMTEIVFKHNGLVNKYLGDGIMAVFGSSDRDRDPEVCAIHAGLEMIRTATSSSYPNVGMFQIGVGVNSGPVMAGYVGARDHLEYTVVGDTVNVAARLEGLSRPNRLYIGPITRAAISSEFETQRMGEMEIRGRSAAIQVYQVLAE
jgi:adenylate cyclase